MTDMTPRLGLPYLLAGQAQKEITHNEALNLLDLLAQATVRDRTHSAPPASPALGDCHVVAAGASGAWSGKDGQIAAWYGGWRFAAPRPGWSLWVEAERRALRWDGGGWAPVPDRGDWRFRGIADGVPASFDWMPRPGAALPAGMSFTRASAAWRCNALGLLESVAADALRHDHDAASGRYRGVLVEEGRSNVLRHCRDLAQAEWVKSGMTVARDQAGVDGVADTASRLSADTADATVMQGVTLAASQRCVSAYVKRLAGSGAVLMTADGGATWTDVSAQLGATGPGGFARVALPAQTLADPAAGFRLAAAGDAVAVDFAQNEEGAFATSPILTGAAAASRAPEALSVPVAAFVFAAGEGTLAVEAEAGPGDGMLAAFSDGGGNRLGLGVVGGQVQATVVAATLTLGAAGSVSSALAWSAGGAAACSDGGEIAAAAGGPLPPPSLLAVGSLAGTSDFLNGHVRRVAYLPRRLADAVLREILTGA